jgi:hypothetical protein
VNFWTVQQGSINLTQGNSTYNLPNDTVDLLEHVIRTGAGNVSTQVDLTITRISVSTYSSIPNKLQEARPIQVWINRQAPTPTITVWPTPDQTGVYQFVYWYLRRIQDAGAGGTYTQDIPFRFLPCLVSGLAYYLALKIPGAMDQIAGVEGSNTTLIGIALRRKTARRLRCGSSQGKCSSPELPWQTASLMGVKVTGFVTCAGSVSTSSG